MRGDGDRPSDGIDLMLPLDIASVRAACEAVLSVADPTALTLRDRTTIELVTEEVVMNIVRHAFDDPAGHRFRLQAAREGRLLTMRFTDAGRPFDPTTAPVRTAAASLELTEPGGLGLPLLRRRTRSMHYERESGQNVLTLTMTLGAEAPRPPDAPLARR